MKERIHWIDFLKVISITLVVVGHIPIPTNETFSKTMELFRMPLFFFVSGLLTKNRHPKDQLYKNFKSIIIPYVSFYFLSYFIWRFITFPRNPELFGVSTSYKNVLLKPFIGMLYGNGYHTDQSYMVHLALWFVVCLFNILMLHSVSLFFSKKIRGFYVMSIFISVLCIILLNKYDVDLYFSLDSALLAYPFFATAFLIANYSNIVDYYLDADSIKKKISFFLVGAGILFGLQTLNPLVGDVGVYNANYGNSILIFYISGFIGILSMLLIAQIYTYNINLIRTLSSGTLIILIFHGWISKVVLIGFNFSINDNWIRLELALLISIVTVLLHIPVINFIRKYLPFLNGGR